MRRARHDDPLPALAAEDEPCFDGSHDRQPLRILHDVVRDRLFWHLLETLQDRGRLVDVILQPGRKGTGGSQAETDQQSERDRQCRLHE